MATERLDMKYIIKRFFRTNIFTKRIYYKLFKIKDSKKRKALQLQCVNVTKAIYDAFENNNLEYAYDYGNLLGLIRDKKFMDHDDDIDLMYFPKDTSEINQLPKLLQPYGFTLDHYYVIDEEIVEYTFEYNQTGLTIDVFIKYDIDGMSTSYWLYQDNNIKYNSSNEMTASYSKMVPVTGFTYVNYWGVDLRIPKNAEEILYWHYGPKWMIKDPNYSEKNSPGFGETDKLGYRVYAKGDEGNNA